MFTFETSLRPFVFARNNYSNDPATSFATDEHNNFKALQQLAHFDIYITRDIDLNTSCEWLAFFVNGAQVLSMSGGKFVDRVVFVAMEVKIKLEYKGESSLILSNFYVVFKF